MRESVTESVKQMSAYTSQIVLYEGAGEHLKLSSEDQYETALAYLAEGYCSRRPQHVQTAHRLLAPLQKKPGAGAGTTDIGKHSCLLLVALTLNCQRDVAVSHLYVYQSVDLGYSCHCALQSLRPVRITVYAAYSVWYYYYTKCILMFSQLWSVLGLQL